jgi:hypothetical protein
MVGARLDRGHVSLARYGERRTVCTPQQPMTALHLESVLDRLGYGASDDLVRDGDRLDRLPVARRRAWEAAKDRLEVEVRDFRVGVNAAYFEGRVPLVYFSGLTAPSDAEIEQAIRTLHRRTWNQSRAQLLVVVLPTEVRVLDGRAAPGDPPDVVVAGGLDDSVLEPFARESLVRGRAADVLPTRTPRKSVVWQLREDLRPTRTKLLEAGLARAVADQLIARCLFAQYLDARHLLPAEDGSSGFIGCLNHSVAETYRLFDALHERFNGDTFVVTPEEREDVNIDHLRVVADLLSGEQGSGQLTLMGRYDFRSIPAEVLGGVYEEFLAEDQHPHAAFYTPGHLVDAALDEAMPVEADLRDARVLDPACGSGLFLARAYERLLDDLEESKGQPLSAKEMAQVLTGRIFGCDLMDHALRVAALSCYLVLLDRLPPTELAENWQLPHLIGNTFRQGDFFEELEYFAGPYEVIASNPPWKEATSAAVRYLEGRQRPAGSKQTLAQAFFWAGVERLATNGRLAMLMPARSLHNRRSNERAFQIEAVEDTGLDLIVDLSAFRHQLFLDAIAPCALYVVVGDRSRRRDHVTFTAPKPGPVSSATGRIAIDSDRIARVPRYQLNHNPDILRQLVFGDMRDVQLVARLREQSGELESFRNRGSSAGWEIGLGYQIEGGDQNDLPFLRRIPSIRPEDIHAFWAETRPPIRATTFHRPRRPELYEGPRVLLARSVDAGRLRAAYREQPASFSESVMALVAPARRRSDAWAMCAYLNSRLARYFLFMTASSWGLERPELKAQDVVALPIPFIDDRDATQELAELAHDGAKGAVEQALANIDALLADICDLTTDDRALIDDRLDVQLPAFRDRHSDAAYGAPTEEQIEQYRKALKQALRDTLDIELDVALQREDEDIVVRVGFGENALAKTTPNPPRRRLDIPDGTLIIRRPQRVYGPNWVELRKPAERKQLTVAAALHESDEITSALLRAGAAHEIQASNG